MLAALIRHALIALILLGSPLLAQTTPAPPTTTVPAVKMPGEKDLRALNFYFQQKDLASVTAELRRLRIVFPGWVPPDDLSKLSLTQPSTEIDTIYRQIAANQLVEARATVVATQKQYPFWVPPVDMIRLLELAEGQAQLDAALDAGNASQALQIASSVDGLLRCDRVNNAWRIAKAEETQQAGDAALATYTGVMNACPNYPDIVATLEKSDSVTTDGELADLFGIGKTRFPAKAPELAKLHAKLLAGRGKTPEDILAQTGVLPEPVVTTADGTAPDIPHIRPMPRPTSFAQAPVRTTAPNPKPREAAAANLGRAMTPAQCLAATNSARTAQTLAQRGWCAYNLNRPMESLSDFQSAEPNLPGTQRRDARFGMALSYLKLNMTDDASRMAATTDLTHEQRLETESIILNQRGVQAFKVQEFPKAITYFDALEQMKGALPRDLAIMRGYAYLNSGNRPKAREIFLALHNQLATAETLAGLKATE